MPARPNVNHITLRVMSLDAERWRGASRRLSLWFEEVSREAHVAEDGTSYAFVTYERR